MQKALLPDKEVLELERGLEALARIRLHLRKSELAIKLFFKKKEGLYKDPPYNGIKESVEKQIEKMRKDIDKLIAKLAKKHPMWDAFFRRIKGISPVYAGMILGLFPAYKFPNPSALRKYVGWAPPHVYEGRRYRRNFKSIFYIIAMNFLRVENKYASEYYAWRKKEDLKLELAKKYADKISEKTEENVDEELAMELGIESPEELQKLNPPASKRHAHFRAIRKVISMFLAHYFEMYWRVVLKVTNPPKPYFVIKGMGEYFPPEAFFDL